MLFVGIGAGEEGELGDPQEMRLRWQDERAGRYESIGDQGPDAAQLRPATLSKSAMTTCTAVSSKIFA